MVSQSDMEDKTPPPPNSDKTMANRTIHKTHEEGTVVDADTSYLISSGYKPQLQRKFSWMQLFSCAFIVTNSWLGVTGGFSTGLTVGGSATVIYGLIIVAVFNVAIIISLSELVSSMPNAGGQYFWAKKLAPPSQSRISAYICGICNLLGGLTGVSSGAVAASYMILGCINLSHPDFDIKAWQAFLIAVVFILLSSLLNFHESVITKSVVLGLWWCLMSCYAITIIPAAVAKEHAGPIFIFNSTENSSGWSSTGMAFLVGMINANYAFGLIDAGVHMAEEIPEPEKNVPKALFMAVGIGFITAWPLACALIDCAVDIDAIAGTSTGVPLLQLFYLSLRNNVAGSIFMQLLVVTSYFWCIAAAQTYQSRICWAFSRDQGLPFSRLWSQVHPRSKVPVNAHILCVCFSIILCILPLASTTAFNRYIKTIIMPTLEASLEELTLTLSLVTGVIIFPYISIIIPVFYSLLPRNKDVPKGPFNLGRWGTVARVFTILYCTTVSVIYCFPYAMPVTAGDMNYISAVIGLVALYAAIDWFMRARKYFDQKDQ
ncbi:hypothetical protein FE257_008267 [Aspergillus nanangensis]|uniref:Uncharacterized protein n=1 Tax=Aspergillus nanangensis TaxID=2582783 RepID=A0AAD4GTN8_ASPNN|nr:hypothetical protein FE257_008267 [Aspergillus nanangensis]